MKTALAVVDPLPDSETLDALRPNADEAGASALAAAIEKEIAGLEALCGGMARAGWATDRLKPLHRSAHDVRGLGAVSHPLLAAVGGSLCLLLERLMARKATRITPLREAAIAMHVRKLRQIHDDGLVGRGGEAGARLVAGLRAVVEKASA
jgi:hypothetical protein